MARMTEEDAYTLDEEITNPDIMLKSGEGELHFFIPNGEQPPLAFQVDCAAVVEGQQCVSFGHKSFLKVLPYLASRRET